MSDLPIPPYTADNFCSWWKVDCQLNPVPPGTQKGTYYFCLCADDAAHWADHNCGTPAVDGWIPPDFYPAGGYWDDPLLAPSSALFGYSDGTRSWSGPCYEFWPDGLTPCRVEDVDELAALGSCDHAKSVKGCWCTEPSESPCKHWTYGELDEIAYQLQVASGFLRPPTQEEIDLAHGDPCKPQIPPDTTPESPIYRAWLCHDRVAGTRKLKIRGGKAIRVSSNCDNKSIPCTQCLPQIDGIRVTIGDLFCGDCNYDSVVAFLRGTFNIDPGYWCRRGFDSPILTNNGPTGAPIAVDGCYGASIDNSGLLASGCCGGALLICNQGTHLRDCCGIPYNEGGFYTIAAVICLESYYDPTHGYLDNWYIATTTVSLVACGSCGPNMGSPGFGGLCTYEYYTNKNPVPFLVDPDKQDQPISCESAAGTLTRLVSTDGPVWDDLRTIEVSFG